MQMMRQLALGLFAALGNAKMIDGIVAWLFEHFKTSQEQAFKDQIL
jgi:hypothetical protein